MAVRGDRSSRSAPAPSSSATSARRRGDRSAGAARDARVHREHVHFTGVGEAQLQSEPDDGEELGRDRGDGRRRPRRRPSRASGLSDAAGTRRNGPLRPIPHVEGLPAPRVARRGVAEQSGVAHARQRPRVFANAKAMEPSGSREPRRAPAGGEILKDSTATRPGFCASGRSRSSARGAPATPAAAIARRWSSRRARGAVERDHDVRGRRIAVRHHRGDEEHGRRGQARLRLWVMLREDNASAAPTAEAVPDDRLRRQPSHRARHQAPDGRRARLARRVDARAVHRQAGQHRAQHRLRSTTIERDRPAGDRERLPDVRPRDRRSRQPRDAEHLRTRIQGESGEERTCGGGSSTRSTSRLSISRGSGSSA